ncbi:MAG: TonB-dependent receptor plug domain-containing protein [Gemmatimonadaceae bacterium]
MTTPCRQWRSVSVFLIGSVLISATHAAAQQPTPPPKQATDTIANDLEQLMKIEIVVAGSKRAQDPRDVPSFVSVVTAADIKEHGYRTLADVLRTLPGFYVSNDRNYSYIGVRGFSRPGDFNARVLLLLNGLRTNENVFDLAYIGEEFSVDVDLIERVEVIRGPSSAIYGSNAFFAVINVVTRSGSSLAGTEITTSAASFGTYSGRASYGHTFANGLDLLASGTYSDGKGRNLYFPEFDAPATNNGIANGDDHEGFRKLLVTASKGNFSFQANNVSREKGLPTGSYSSTFNDPRNRTTDGLSLASLSYERNLANSATFSTRVHAGRYAYDGEYAYSAFAPNKDVFVGEWWGLDIDAARKIGSRQFLTYGAEYRDNFKMFQTNYDPEPYVLYSYAQDKSTRWGAFAQDEIRLADPLMLYAGLRVDRYDGFGYATTPRAALIYTPSSTTTFKLLAGRAFRAPSNYELQYNDTHQSTVNPQLEPEHIETLELTAQRLIGGGVEISASAFRNRLTHLLSRRTDTTSGSQYFGNVDETHSRGVELGLNVNRGHGLTGKLSYSFQRTEDRAIGIQLSNSPEQMVQMELRSPILGSAASASVDAQYMSARSTLLGNIAGSHVLTNFSLFAPRTFGRFDLSASVYNVFDARYGDPVSNGFVQDLIQQDGRSFRVRTTLHY